MGRATGSPFWLLPYAVGVLEFDHILCFVPADGGWVQRLEQSGWGLDAGVRHEGQGTRNRRVHWPDCYLELLWVEDRRTAASNPLRLDRRAEWTCSGASPFGIVLRGEVPPSVQRDYWPYDRFGFPLWIHRDNEQDATRPLVVIHESSEEERGGLRPSARVPQLVDPNAGRLSSIRLTGPSPAACPPFIGPALTQQTGPPQMHLIISGQGPTLQVTDLLTLST